MIELMDASNAESLLRMAEDARASMRGPNSGTATAQMTERYADLLAALDWHLDRAEIDGAYRLATALVPFWMTTKRIDDGDRWFERALQVTGGSDLRRARALYDHGYLVFWAGRYELAAERFTAARSLAMTANDPTVVALALAGSARVALNDDVEEAVRLLREAVRVTDGTTDVEGRSSAMHVMAVALQMSGDLEGARAVMSERIEMGRQRGEDFVVWVESANLSMVERQLGNLARARSLSRDALEIVSKAGNDMAIPWVINGLAAVTAAQADYDRAARLLGMAEAMLGRAGGEWPPDERVQYEGTLAVLSGALAPADLESARAEGARMTTAQGVAYALAGAQAKPQSA